MTIKEAQQLIHQLQAQVRRTRVHTLGARATSERAEQARVRLESLALRSKDQLFDERIEHTHTKMAAAHAETVHAIGIGQLRARVAQFTNVIRRLVGGEDVPIEELEALLD